MYGERTGFSPILGNSLSQINAHCFRALFAICCHASVAAVSCI